MSKHPSLVFFGTSDFAVAAFETLVTRGVTPRLIVTTPDTPAGRKLVLTPPPVKVWAERNNLPVRQPEKLRTPSFAQELAADGPFDLFIVASYGKILPTDLIALPRRGTINIHPSLLPKYRGPSPIQSTILADDRDVGVSIMQIDAEVDHGAILAQRPVVLEHWPVTTPELKRTLAIHGANMLADVLPDWLEGTLQPVEQNHTRATFTRKFEKEDGELSLSGDARKNLLIVKALGDSPGAFFFDGAGTERKRIKVLDAEIRDGVFTPTRVIPEGKREMDYASYLRGKR